MPRGLAHERVLSPFCLCNFASPNDLARSLAWRTRTRALSHRNLSRGALNFHSPDVCLPRLFLSPRLTLPLLLLSFFALPSLLHEPCFSPLRAKVISPSQSASPSLFLSHSLSCTYFKPLKQRLCEFLAVVVAPLRPPEREREILSLLPLGDLMPV